jgi:hypothetical protein
MSILQAMVDCEAKIEEGENEETKGRVNRQGYTSTVVV